MRNPEESCVAVVDDDESVCRSFSRLLRMSGFHPVVYHSAEAFLEDPEHSEFDCLVLDIQLGGMSGLELRERLLEEHDETPVIFITAQDDPEFRTRAEASGCAGYFKKTDPGALIFESIERLVADRRREPEGGPAEPFVDLPN